MEQFVQRLAVQCNLSPLDERETEEYILHALDVAGGKGRRIFEKEALQAVWKYSRGIPRIINVLCDTPGICLRRREEECGRGSGG